MRVEALVQVINEARKEISKMQEKVNAMEHWLKGGEIDCYCKGHNPYPEYVVRIKKEEPVYKWQWLYKTPEYELWETTPQYKTLDDCKGDFFGPISFTDWEFERIEKSKREVA